MVVQLFETLVFGVNAPVVISTPVVLPSSYGIQVISSLTLASNLTLQSGSSLRLCGVVRCMLIPPRSFSFSHWRLLLRLCSGTHFHTKEISDEVRECTSDFLPESAGGSCKSVTSPRSRTIFVSLRFSKVNSSVPCHADLPGRARPETRLDEPRSSSSSFFPPPTSPGPRSEGSLEESFQNLSFLDFLLAFKCASRHSPGPILCPIPSELPPCSSSSSALYLSSGRVARPGAIVSSPHHPQARTRSPPSGARSC